MSWTERVICPCGVADWVVRDGGWSCYYCAAPMPLSAIEAFHHLEDCERWLAAESAWVMPGGAA